MNLKLIKMIDFELYFKRYLKLRWKINRFQFYIYFIKIINIFSEIIILSIISWFQEILKMIIKRILRINHQKLAILQCFLLKNYYYNTLIYKYSFLWKKMIKRKRNEDYDKIKLELKNIIQKYEFEWLFNDIFNWEMNIFMTEIMD